ncbi:aminotransferase class V-fold PLP-dependent enzyme [Patiriisocius hiemis]|uniref:Aminotransferase class V-fold PLP-dependent enzyme n=1 Tax=Patiriisocius hiemis TaxID=3075604 RepID=A0ABU2YB11_9FLAO|nr:aminotransferase class V-fold PLP-dependent enzyme [Constantimarinum sp. W242]MDT0555379.1 aminotransferase class V-fold PLP-dependent enzyme [Constantimarinum sp. W242]
MSPQLKSVEAIGINNLKRKSNPFSISVDDFFSEKKVLKNRFTQLIEAPDPEYIAIIPSVSYGIANAVANIPFLKGDEIIVLEEQFPSNYYAWKQLEKEKGVVVKTITAPPISKDRASRWNTDILNTISKKTKCVAIPQVHWADGTLFNLREIKEKVAQADGYLIIDGTQSVGAMPFSVNEIQPDALICGGYKWLLGPYSIGVAYYGERFHNGTPIENNWMNHIGSENFTNLVNYNHLLKPKATRYDVGESSNFILTPMLSEAIKQLLEWKPANIQEYCKSINQKAINTLLENGYFIEDAANRGHHLFGIYLPKNRDIETLKSKIKSQNISVSYRGNAIRVSPSVYNSKEELEKLVSCFI